MPYGPDLIDMWECDGCGEWLSDDYPFCWPCEDPEREPNEDES